MNPIWATLIIQYGIPYAFEIWKIIGNKAELTQGDWDKLLALNAKPLSVYVTEASLRLGIPIPTQP